MAKNTKIEEQSSNTEGREEINSIELDPKFLQTLEKEKEKLELPRAAKLTLTQTDQVLTKIEETYSLNRNQAITILAILFQQGGTARRCDGNLTVKLFNKEIKLAEIRAILRKQGLKNAERKLARSLATNIQKISVALELQGNLAKKITKNNVNLKLTISDLAWLSDFQSDNEECPGPLKQYINECFQTKVDNQPKNQQKKKTGK